MSMPLDEPNVVHLPPRAAEYKLPQPVEDRFLNHERYAPDISPFFGDTALFFPLAPTALGQPRQWRDPHPCLWCGASVSLPLVHANFHAKVGF